MTDHTNPPSANSGDDLLLRRYAEANALDEARPSPTVREAVLAQARVQAAAHAQAIKAASEAPLHQSAKRAANDSAWQLRALGSLAVLGLVGLLVLQFDRGSPDEQELALGRPSASTAQRPAAPARAEIPVPPREEVTTATSPTPAPNTTATDGSAERPALAKSAPPKMSKSTPEVRPTPPFPTPQPEAAMPAPTPPAAFTPPPAAAPRAQPLPPEARTSMARRSESSAAADVADAGQAAAVPAPSAFPAAPAAPTPGPPSQESLARAPTGALSDSTAPDNEPATPSKAEPAMQAKRSSPSEVATLGRSREAAPRASASASDASAERLSEAPAIHPERALLAAAGRGSLQGVRDALAQGADVNHARQPDGRSALMLAAQRGDAAMLRLLIDSGADLQRLDREGLSAADWARRAGQTSVLPLLESAPGR